MSDINTSVLAGRCTKNAQERKGGVVIVSLACNRARKTDDGFEQDVLYMDIVVLGGLGKRAAKLKKGDPLTCSGRLEMNVWNHDDGTTRRSIRLVANEITAERFFHKADGGQESPVERHRQRDDGVVLLSWKCVGRCCRCRLR